MARIKLAASVFVFGLVVAGCGSDGDGSSVTLPSSVSLPDRSTTTGSAPDVTGTTRPPVTRPGTTEAPETTTEPGTTVPPPTITPTTPAPPTTATPTTVPTTEATTTTAPTTTAPTTTATTTTEATTTTVSVPADGTDDGSGTVWWPWALIAALVAVLIGLLVVRNSRGKAAAAARTDAALGRAADVATHLAVVVPANAQAMAAQETGQLAAVAAELDVVAADGSDEQRAAALRRVSAQARVLHQVADGVALSPGPPTEDATEQLRSQAALLHTVATETGAELHPAP